MRGRFPGSKFSSRTLANRIWARKIRLSLSSPSSHVSQNGSGYNDNQDLKPENFVERSLHLRGIQFDNGV